MGKIFFGSDFHFGHQNILNYCSRPYRDLEEMHLAIVSIWNNTVTPEDTVYVLGDFSLNPKWAELMLPQMNGTKILIPGNHDACFNWFNRSYTKKMNVNQRYKNAGFSEIYQTHELRLKDGTFVRLSHLPYSSEEGNEFDSRYNEYRLKDQGGYLCHGHLHGRYRKYNNMIDVGFDGDLKLWSEDEIIGLMNDPRDFISTPITKLLADRKDQREAT